MTREGILERLYNYAIDLFQEEYDFTNLELQDGDERDVAMQFYKHYIELFEKHKTYLKS